MLLKIAWRNIWRVPIRSFVVIGAVAVGVWAVISLMSFSFGIVESYVRNAIRYQTSHIQLHDKQFKEDQAIRFFLPDAENRAQKIAAQANVEAVSLRTLVAGMLANSKGTQGIFMRGIDPEAEAKVTNLSKKIIDGAYFSTQKNPILVGKPLADKLGLKVGKKVVLQFQNAQNELIASAFRIAGIYDTGNTLTDLAQIYVERKELNQLLGAETAAHEIAIFLQDATRLEESQNLIQTTNPGILVENFREISAELQLSEASMAISSVIFISIFMLALIFGIINTMLMAVLERTRELGMLMAIGMNKQRIFLQIMLETFILGVVGAPIGLAMGWLTVLYFKRYGLDLSAFATGMRNFGLETVVYPSINGILFLRLVIGVTLTAILAAIYPALKAISLKPVEAIRKI